MKRLIDLLQKPKTPILLILTLFIISVSQLSFGQTIIYPADSSLQESMAAKEVRRYIYLRTGKRLPMEKVNSMPETGGLILIAEDNNKIIDGLKGSLNHKTPTGGFIIKTVNKNSREILVITGYDSVSTLYGAYRFAEHLGVGFSLTRDAIPDKKIPLDISGFDEAGTPLLQTRGILPFHDFFEGPDLWDIDEYMTVISQLPKLGMNFIGLHTYPRWSTLWDKERNYAVGPEPTVWIGTEQDINSDGTVKWSYPAYYAHTHSPGRPWGFAQRDTRYFHAGASQLFETNGFGSDLIGEEIPSDVTSSNLLFNRVGKMLKKSFDHASNLGVKTALGTELTLGVYPEGEGTDDDWIKGMPPKLQERLQARGKDLTAPSTIKEVYKGIFERIKRTHSLDYYWLWSWEGWARWGANPESIKAFENEIGIAYQALQEVNAPFQLALAGWMIGTEDNPAEFDRALPPEVPFYGLWDRALGFEELNSDRVKWPATWLEEDWGLLQLQLEADRVYVDAKAALDKKCNGLIAKHWRTRVLSPNIGAMKVLWVYGQTGQPPEMKIPTDMNKWINEFYIDWANRQFGTEVAPQAAEIFAEIDTSSDPGWASPKGIMDWDTDLESGGNGSPGAISPNPEPWASEKSKYDFVAEFENLRDKVVGPGNLERFDYWLNALKCYRIMGEYGTVRYQFEEAAENENWSEALTFREEMARLFEELIKHEIEKASNSSDLGEIINLEILNWYQLVRLKWDEKMKKGLGREIPASANPSMEYDGKPLIMVDALRTSLYENESLRLKARVMGKPRIITLLYRPLGKGKYQSKQFHNIGRGVFSVTLPPQQSDFEYYIEAEVLTGNIVYPATAPNLNQTIIVIK
jgi:hypothetical protein